MVERRSFEELFEPGRAERVERMMRDEIRIPMDYASLANDMRTMPVATREGVFIIVAPQDQHVALGLVMGELVVVAGVTMSLLQAETLVTALKTQIERAADYEEEA